MSSRVPLFNDFIKPVKDLFKKDKYDLGQVYEISYNAGEVAATTKISLKDSTPAPKLTSKFSPSWGKIETVLDPKGLKVEAQAPKVVKEVNLKTSFEGGPKKIEVELTQPSNDKYWNWQAKGAYTSGKTWKTTLSGALGDDQSGISVGGEVEYTTNVGELTFRKDNCSYALGLLWRPNDSSGYSVKFTPEKGGAGLDYSFYLWNQYTPSCQIAARAEGRADINFVAPDGPTISFAGLWGLGNNNLQAFFNTKQEWGASYKVPVSGSITATLGLTSLKNSDGKYDTKFGYKVQLK